MALQGDDADIANEFADRHSSVSLALHLNRERPVPEFDDAGQKICIECGVEIPPLRAAIREVARCLGCQTEVELEDKRFT